MAIYKFGVIIGRFQPFHIGHEEVIDKALKLCDKVAVFIGSSQEEGTERNPFSYPVRRAMLKRLYIDSIDVYALPDIDEGDNNKWGKYVLEQIIQKCGTLPDIIISGAENCRVNWFEGLNVDMDMLYISKSTPISATKMREYLKTNNRYEWCRNINKDLWYTFDDLRQKILKEEEQNET